VIQCLEQREMALMRTLLIGGKAAADPRTLAGARKTEAMARKAFAEIDDELLA
jgi:hypothetical protein